MNEELQRNYARAGFGTKVAFGQSPALLIIDFVQAYLIEDSPLYAGVEATQAAAIRLLQAAREAKLLVVHTFVEYEPGGRNGGVFFRKVPALRCFERGVNPALSAFAPGLEPIAGETVIGKQYASAFFGTSLQALFTASGIDTVLIAGLSTSGCVRASAVDCCQHGFVPVVVREAVGDRAAGPHEASLFDLQAKYAEVIGMDAALAYIKHVTSPTSAIAQVTERARP